MSRTIDHQPSVPPADLPSLLMEGLACAALQPGLRSVLVFDGSPLLLRAAAGVLSEMLGVTTEQAVKLVYLGPIATEETLWGSLALMPRHEAQPFAWQAGLLGAPGEEELRLVVIPDLTRLSLAAARACIALMGAEVAHLERHGQQSQWRSRLCWLAGCPRSQVQFLSPHLLDRFALRLTGQDLQPLNRANDLKIRTAALRDWFDTLAAPTVATPLLSEEWRDRLQTARQQHPLIAQLPTSGDSLTGQKPVGQGCDENWPYCGWLRPRRNWPDWLR